MITLGETHTLFLVTVYEHTKWKILSWFTADRNQYEIWGYHSGVYEVSSLPGYSFNIVQFNENQLLSLRIIFFPSSGSKNKLSEKSKYSRVQKYTAPPQILKASVVLLLVYDKQTVTVIVPLHGAYCSAGSDSHTHAVIFCEVWAMYLLLAVKVIPTWRRES